MSFWYRFPEFQMPSGKWMRFDLLTQDVSNRQAIAAPINTGLTSLTINPLLQDGVPELIEEGLPEAGYIGFDGVEFVFANIVIIPLSGKTLLDILREQNPEDTLVNMKLFVSDTSGLYGFRPLFEGFIEPRSYATEEVLFFEQSRGWQIRVTVKNIISILERVTVPDWLQGHLSHATYDKTPTQVEIDGTDLFGYWYQYDEQNQDDWRFLSFTNIKFFMLEDIVNSLSDAIAVTTGINNGHGFKSSWVVYDTDDTGYSLDQLAIPSRLTTIDASHYKRYGFFDAGKSSQVSLHREGNALGALKRLLVPWGLTARITSNIDGTRYMEVRESELDSGEVSKRRLKKPSMEPGENARDGFRVVTPNNGEYLVGDQGQGSLDMPYMSAARLRLGERWTHTGGTGFQDHETDDIPCLVRSVFIYDTVNDIAYNVAKVLVMRDGMAAPVGGVTLEPDADPIPFEYSETAAIGMGNLFQKMASAYYYNGTQDVEESEIGVYRRYTNNFEWQEYALRYPVIGTDDAGTLDRLSDVGMFPEEEDSYKYRRVFNYTTGDHANVVSKVSDDVLVIDNDIMNIGDKFILEPAGPGMFKMLNSMKYIIRRLRRSLIGNVVGYELEKTGYEP